MCWAAASNMEHRLTDILRHESDPPLPVATFEAIYEECYRDHIPLGETLVERGYRDARRALCAGSCATPRKLFACSDRRRRSRRCGLRTQSAATTPNTHSRRRSYLRCAGSFGFEEQAAEAQQTLREITPREADRTRVPLRAVSRAPARTGRRGRTATAKSSSSWANGFTKRLPEGEDDEESVDAVESVNGTTLRRAWRAGPLIYLRFVGSQELAG